MEEKFSDRLKKLKNDRGFSSSDLARLLDITPTAVWNWENGNTQPRYASLLNMSRIFGVSVDYLKGVDLKEDKHGDFDEIISAAQQSLAAIFNINPERIKLRLEII